MKHTVNELQDHHRVRLTLTFELDLADHLIETCAG